jgi:hypothetical protein
MADAQDGTGAASAMPVAFKRGRAGKRRRRAADDEDDDGDDAVIKQNKADLKGSIQVSTKAAGRVQDDGNVHTATGELQQGGDMGATRALEENTERQMDQRTQREAAMGAGAGDDGKYHGMRGYKDYREVHFPSLYLQLIAFLSAAPCAPSRLMRSVCSAVRCGLHM